MAKAKKERYYGIECNSLVGFGCTNDDVVIHGPFNSVERLKKHLIVEAGLPEVRPNELHEGENDDWGSDVIIVKEVGTVKAVPTVLVHMGLKNVKKHKVGESTHTDESRPGADDEA